MKLRRVYRRLGKRQAAVHIALIAALVALLFWLAR